MKFRFEPVVDGMAIGILASEVTGGMGRWQFWAITFGWAFVSSFAAMIDRHKST